MYIPLEISEVKRFPQGTPTIIIPFRDNAEQERGAQLTKFVSHMKRYHPDWNVLVIEQSDDGKKFNRGALLNIGSRIAATHNLEYVIFHDVDLIPLSVLVPYYTAIPDKPIHIAKVWTTKYDSPDFLGGVLSMSLADIKRINGFPNTFFGWGGEDDALRNRIKAKKLDVYQPTLRGQGFKELSHVDSRTKTEWKNMEKWENLAADKRNPTSGVKNVRYTVVATEDISDHIKKITVDLK
jgi:hypothetical protein